jgi:hypothetical protein
MVTRHNRIKHSSAESEHPAAMLDQPEGRGHLKSDGGACEVNTGKYERPQSQTFFDMEVNNQGLDYLVSYAHFKQSNVSTHMDPRDTDMFFTLSHFVATLTRTQRETLAEVLDHTTRTAVRQKLGCVSKEKKMWAVAVPTTKEEIRATICEGKHSLFNNLPHPMIHKSGDHAYILPSDCILDLFGHGLSRLRTKAPFPIVQRISVSKKAISFMVEAGGDNIEFEYLTIWSDDFEPNYAKGNRGSVWIKTMSIHSRDTMSLPLTHVYPVAVGPKNVDHTEVEKIILQDILSLSMYNREQPWEIYNGSKKKKEAVSVHLLAVIQDQPERRGNNGLMLGTSTYHPRWGYCMDFYENKEKLCPCNDCFTKMTSVTGNDPWDMGMCESCNNWALHLGHPSLHFGVEEDFPADDELTEEGKLLPKELSYEYLKQVVQKTHEKVVNGEWKKVQAEEYLRVNCMNTSAQEEILECAGNCAALESAHLSDDVTILESIAQLQEEEPKKYRMWEWPSVWDSGLLIQDSCEAAMHELFLGVMATIVELIQKWSKKRRIYTSLQKYFLELTKSIEKLHLTWCKCMPYAGEKLGGWKSENYMAFARIAPWVYSGLSFLSADPPYTEPHKPQVKWTVIQNREWLTARGIPHANKKMEELRAFVAAKIIEEPALPLIGPLGGPIITVHKLVKTMIEMVSLLMGMSNGNDSDVKTAHRLIRLFLTSCFHFDENLRGENPKKLPFWLTCYNFLCLLNLPEQIQEHGPIRNRWEGGFSGEGYLRMVKSTIASATRKNWAPNLLSALLRHQTLLLLKDQARSSVREEQQTAKSDDTINNLRPLEDLSGNYRCYSSFAEVSRDFHNGQPISSIVTEGGVDDDTTFWVAYLVKRIRYVVRLEASTAVIDDADGKLGMIYLNWELVDEVQILGELANISSFAVLLPLLDGHGIGHPTVVEQYYRTYTAIDFRWRQLTPQASLKLPHYNNTT